MLFRVYKYDEEWCKLQSRKKSLKRLFEQCREFQYEKIVSNPDGLEAPISDDIKLVKVRTYLGAIHYTHYVL